jgi:DNA mismatch repair ATPase MutS
MLQEDILIFLWFILEFFKILFNIEAIFNELILREIEKKRNDLIKMFEFIGEMDCAISTATLLQINENICVPKFINAKELKINNLSHPLVKNCIPNDLYLSNESLVITGSNMSGKTTFIRALGLNIIFSQTIHLAFAKQFEIPFSNIYSSIRSNDNVLESRSYYMDEILTIKKFIFNLEPPNFNIILFDEILKGTNSLERIAISKNILDYLNQKNCIIIASTHDFEIASFLQDKNYKTAYFEDLIEENTLKFNYKIQFGLKETRNAVKLLKVNNFPSSLISNIESSINNSFL